MNSSEKLLRLLSVAFAVCIATLIFSMAVARGKCINKGYELSRMAQVIQNRRIALEQAESRRAELVSSEKLFPVAEKKGFILMQEGKTFNVQ